MYPVSLQHYIYVKQWHFQLPAGRMVPHGFDRVHNWCHRVLTSSAYWENSWHQMGDHPEIYRGNYSISYNFLDQIIYISIFICSLNIVHNIAARNYSTKCWSTNSSQVDHYTEISFLFIQCPLYYKTVNNFIYYGK